MKTIISLFAIIFTTVTAIAQPRGEQAIFDAASNSYIDYGKGIKLSGYGSINGGGKMTLTLWLKWDDKAVAGPWANLFTLNDSVNNGDNGVFWVQHSQANDKIEFALTTKDGNRHYIQSNTNPEVGTWYHVACVFDGALNSQNMKLYINGILEASVTTQTSNNQNNNSRKIASFSNVSKLYAGRWAYPSARSFNGWMDEISVWSKALTIAEINSMKNDPESVTGIAYNATNLVGYYNFDNRLPEDLTNINDGIAGGGLTFTNNTSLPVELIRFDLRNSNQKVVVEWSTATETNNNYFTVERSFDGVNAEVIGVVNGAGNSNMVLGYQFEDQQPLSGIVYYRIKQTDFDGTTEVFDWKSVRIDREVETLYNVYPNPTNGNINISLSNTQSSTTAVNVIDLTGRVIYNTIIESENSIHTSIDMPSDAPAGIYFVEVVNADKRYVEKIVLK